MWTTWAFLGSFPSSSGLSGVHQTKQGSPPEHSDTVRSGVGVTELPACPPTEDKDKARNRIPNDQQLSQSEPSSLRLQKTGRTLLLYLILSFLRLLTTSP